MKISLKILKHEYEVKNTCNLQVTPSRFQIRFACTALQIVCLRWGIPYFKKTLSRFEIDLCKFKGLFHFNYLIIRTNIILETLVYLTIYFLLDFNQKNSKEIFFLASNNIILYLILQTFFFLSIFFFFH